MCTMCMRSQRQEDIGSSRTGITDGYNPPRRWQKLHQVLCKSNKYSTAEPSFQPSPHLFDSGSRSTGWSETYKPKDDFELLIILPLSKATVIIDVLCHYFLKLIKMKTQV